MHDNEEQLSSQPSRHATQVKGLPKMIQKTQRTASSQDSLQASKYFTNLHSRSPCVLHTRPTCSNRTPASAPCIIHVQTLPRRAPATWFSSYPFRMFVDYNNTVHPFPPPSCIGYLGCWIRAQALCKALCLLEMTEIYAVFGFAQKISEAVHCIRRSGRRMENLHGEEIYRAVKRKRRSIYGHPDLRKRT